MDGTFCLATNEQPGGECSYKFPTSIGNISLMVICIQFFLKSINYSLKLSFLLKLEFTFPYVRVLTLLTAQERCSDAVVFIKGCEQEYIFVSLITRINIYT